MRIPPIIICLETFDLLSETVKKFSELFLIAVVRKNLIFKKCENFLFMFLSTKL